MTFYNGTKVEMRNIGLVNFNDDGIQLKGTQHAWIHHNDFFYGNAGSAADQKKGDGSLDVKDDSRYCTFSYNHFWDSGKTSLCGMKSESGSNFISYDHNWFDHSDSRHPRVRTMTVHVWNNYYDGVSKIGVGAVKGADIFVESNYFRNSKNPMLISEQGTDGRGGFADDHDGGMIKAYGNVLTGKSATTFRSHKQYPVEFDAYEADTRDEKVPETYKSVVGEYTYNNFDTDASLMYNYTPVAANDVPGIVTGAYGAGRMNHGDLQWTFNNTTDDTSDAINDALKAAVMGYHTTLIGIMGEEEETSGGGEQGGGDEPAPEGAILASFDGSPSSSMFTVGGSYGDGKITYNSIGYKKGVKLDSKGSITFMPASNYLMTLVLATAKDGRDVKINNETTTVSGTENSEGKYYELQPIAITKGTQYVLTKGSKESIVMLIKLEPVAE
jgi:pectate lyase